MVNRGDGKGRKAANVTAVRAVFLDLVVAPLAPVMASPIPPAIVCESSPGNHHAYTPLADMPLGCSNRAHKSPDAEERRGVEQGVRPSIISWAPSHKHKKKKKT